jgi:hypothetical protein
VALVLSLKTGHVSPQFHGQFNDLFDTRKRTSGNPRIPSLWQEQTGFARQLQRDTKLDRKQRPGKHRQVEVPEELTATTESASIDEDSITDGDAGSRAGTAEGERDDDMSEGFVAHDGQLGTIQVEGLR